MKEHYPS